ncbi:unnamed protein product [Cyclocybe aegerita]|uniref:Enoyl reductase (ER) domain-containing protein n=1 Tax=Cyclocybe aegerita TaxID=1973307 RepID=A0A8S0WGX4_CYCAE|nr:unnamed protein product [Cyclocybe aegerita]
MSTQKALFLEKKFGDFVLGEAPRYNPGPGEVLVKILATALNPLEWLVQKYSLLVENYPAILGSDIAGEVDAVGEGVTDFQKGDRVFGQGHFLIDGRKAGFQQYALFPVSTTVKIPPNISFDEAAALPVAVIRSFVAFYIPPPFGLGLTLPTTPQGAAKYTGTPIAVIGGATSVGQAGATYVFDRDLSAESLKSEVDRVTTSQPLTILFDAVSNEESQKAGLGLLAPGGRLVTVLPLAINLKADDNKSVVSVTTGAASAVPANGKILADFWHNHIARLLESGDIKPNRVEVLPNGLAGIPEGLRRLETNQVSGVKLVVHPHETGA